jgi:predicted nucleic-acid-binding protein
VIGIDTNVLIRILVKDDEKQAQLAFDYTTSTHTNSLIVINSIVFCEVVWVLESAYNYTKKEIIVCLLNILKTKQFLIPDKEIIRLALKLYEESKIDFSDALIGYLNKKQNCNFTITFDKEAAKTDLYKLLE